MGESELELSARSTSGSTASSWNADPSNFLFQVLHTSRPGALDTSLVSTDNINNPRTMNAVYDLCRGSNWLSGWDEETLGQDKLDNKQFNDFVSSGPLTQFFQPPNTVWTPHVLKDGSDSVGALGRAQPRLSQHRPVQRGMAAALQPGGRRQDDDTDPDHDGAGEFVVLAGDRGADPGHGAVLPEGAYPHQLKNAPGGSAYLTDPPATVQRGKVVFADNCAACHSSKAPDPPAAANLGACIGPDYLEVLEPLLGLDQDRRLQATRCARSCRRTISSTTTTCRPMPACR